MAAAMAALGSISSLLLASALHVLAAAAVVGVAVIRLHRYGRPSAYFAVPPTEGPHVLLAHSLQAPDPRNSSSDGLGFAVVSFGQGRQKSDMLLLLMLLMLLPMLLLLLLLGTVAEGIGAMNIRGDEWEGEGQSVVCHMCVMGAVATGSHRLAYISIKR